MSGHELYRMCLRAIPSGESRVAPCEPTALAAGSGGAKRGPNSPDASAYGSRGCSRGDIAKSGACPFITADGPLINQRFPHPFPSLVILLSRKSHGFRYEALVSYCLGLHNTPSDGG